MDIRANAWFRSELQMEEEFSNCLDYGEATAVTTYFQHELDDGAIRTLWAYYQNNCGGFSRYLGKFYWKYSKPVGQQQRSSPREPVRVSWVCQNPSACAVSLCRLIYEESA